MSALFLHHRFEGVDEGWRKKSRSLGQRKQAEGEEGVDALAKTSEQERPLGMSRTQIFRFRRQGNAIRLYEIGKDLLVPCFLETVDLDSVQVEPDRVLDDRRREPMPAIGKLSQRPC